MCVVSAGGAAGGAGSSAALTVTAIRISRAKRSVSASSSCPRSRPSSWDLVKSLGTAMIAVLSWRVTGSLSRSQACWCGLRSSTTPRQACSSDSFTSDFGSGTGCSTGSLRLSGGRGGSTLVGHPAAFVPQVCPQVVNPAPMLWTEPARDASRGPSGRCFRRSDAPFRHLWRGSHALLPDGSPRWRGTSLAANLTPSRDLGQPFIHRPVSQHAWPSPWPPGGIVDGVEPTRRQRRSRV